MSEQPSNIRLNWNKVSDRLPKHGQHVLASFVNSCNKRRYIIGFYLERWTEPATSDDENDEYSEELDDWFLKAGWYEAIENWCDFASVVVSEGEIDYWTYYQ